MAISTLAIHALNGGGESESGEWVGNVQDGGSFPTTRPDGTALVEGDYVRPTGTFPFTIAGVTFTSTRDKAYYVKGIWMLDAGVIQDTSETPVADKAAESVSGTAQRQSAINKENVKALQTDDTSIDRNSDSKLEVKDGGVSTDKLATDAVTNDKLADDAVETSNIKDANVTEAKLADSAVTTPKLGPLSVTTPKIDDDAVTIDKFNDGNISTAIADAASAVDTKLTTEKAVRTELDKKDITVEKRATAEASYLATYDVKQNGVAVGVPINIPLDYLVKSAECKTCTEDDKPVAGYKVGDKYLDFVINVKSGTATDEHLYVNVKDLVDTYTGSVTIEINSDNEISVKDGSLTKAKTSAEFWTDNALTGSTTIEGGTVTGELDVPTPTADGAAANKGFVDKMTAVDGTSIDRNSDDKIEIATDGVTTDKIKDSNVTLAKLKNQGSANADKALVVQSDGTIAPSNIKSFKTVSTLSGIVGNDYTAYYLTAPCIVSGTAYEAGIYYWTSASGFVQIANMGSGGTSTSTPIYVGEVSPGDIFPGARPDGTALTIGDYVKPYAGATYPFTVGTVTFTSVKDTAVYMNNGNWLLNASSFQKTSETPVNNVATESINGSSSSAAYQSDINEENATAINGKLAKTDVDGTSIDLNSSEQLEVKDMGITAAKLDYDSVSTEKLVDQCVTGGKIRSQAVGTPELANRAVTTAKVADFSITNAKLADGLVSSSKIGDGAVTLTKLATQSTTEAGKVPKVQSDGTWALETDSSLQPDETSIDLNSDGDLEVAYRGITNEKIGVSAVDTSQLKDKAVTTGKIANESISTALIQTGAVSLDKLTPQATSDEGKVLKVQSDGTWAPEEDSTVDVDSALSSTSENPVQNKIINTALAGKSDTTHTHSAATTSANGFMSSTDKTKLDGIATGATKNIVDSSMSSTSTNAVQNKVVNTALGNKIDTAGTGLTKSGTTLNHSNSVTAQTTAKMGVVTFDAQGHITGFTEKAVVNNLTSTASDQPLSAAQGTTLKANFDLCERTANKTTSISSSSTDTQYPSAKAVYNAISSGGITAQQAYDIAHPVGELVIAFSKPSVPSGITATWEAQAAYDGASLWVDSTQAGGTALDGSLPELTGSIVGVATYASVCDGELFTSVSNGRAGLSGTTNPYTDYTFKASNYNSVYGAAAGTNVVRPTSKVVAVYKRTA